MKRNSYLVGKAFRSFLFASVMTVAASQMGAFIDGLMVSWYVNDAAMSAINLSMPVLQLYFSLCLLFGVGGSLIAGKAIGNHERERASKIFSLSVTSAVITGLTLGALGMIFFRHVINLLCPDPTLSGYAREYMIVTIPTGAIYMLMIVLQLFVALDGEPKRVTAAVSTCIAINLILDFVFLKIFGWGLIGAAVATVVSYVPAIVILLTHFRKKDTLHYARKFNVRELPRIAKMGAPSGFTGLLLSVQIFVCNIIAIDYLGMPGVIVFAVCMYLLRLSMIILTGTIDSFQPVASILAGSGDNKGVAIVLRKAYTFLGISLAIYAAIMILFPGTIGKMFGVSDETTMSIFIAAIPAYSFNIVLQCAIGLLIPVYQVYNNTHQAMIVSVGQPLLPILFFWIFASTGIGAWWGFAAGQIVLLLLLLPIVLRTGRQKMPFFLIPTKSAGELYDTSIVPTIENAGAQLREADKWLESCGVAEPLRFRVEVSCEEILKNIIDHAAGLNRKKASVDMRISLTGGKIKAVIHDGGRPFNPIKQDTHTGIGLLIAKKSCDDMKYEYMFNQNILTMSWETASESKKLSK